jgi:adenosylhomocysteine nucleosidase
MIHIFCALPCEAQPLIQHFKLTKLKRFNLFRVYHSEDKQISLTITGVGKLNAASAVSYHHACFNTSTSDIWLNIGVAGHKDLSIGDILIVNKITDEHDGTHWYPQIVFTPPCDSISLITLDKASADYQDSLFDMEASAFYQMAIRLGTAELIHCLKIISDNTEQSATTVNADKVKKIIAAQINTIESIIERLIPLSTEVSEIIAEPAHYQSFIDKWHFTQSEKLQLSRLLRQWAVRFPDEEPMQAAIDNKKGKQVLISLSEKIKNTEFMLHD